MSFPHPTPKQAQILWLALTGLAVATIVLLAVALIWGMGQVLHILAPVIWPLAIAGVIAYLLDPVVDYFERRRVPRTRAILVVFAGAVVLMLGIVGSIVPQVVTESRALISRIPEYTQNVKARVGEWVSNPKLPSMLNKLVPRRPDSMESNAPPAAGLVVTNATTGAVTTNAPPPGSTSPDASLFWSELFGKDTFKSAADWFAKTAPKIGSWAVDQVSRVASFFGLLAGLALVPVYSFYFLLEKRGIESHWTDYLPVSQSGFKDELIFVIKSINEHLVAFFRGQVLVAMTDGVCYTIGFLLIGLPYAVLLGVMATFLTMIPFLGAIVTCAAALVIAFVQFGDWQHPGLVLAVFAVVQSLEGFVIQPKIMGDRTGLHPLTIIIAVMVGTTVLGGILGGILAIPLTAAGKVLMLRYVWKKREA
jgi:predicted PurR-regulated permease PerM